MKSSVVVSEVGPRDGLQNLAHVVPFEIKKAWIEAEFNAGIRDIEVGSFVPASLLPQMSDTALLVEFAGTLPGLTVGALVPNLQGAKAAASAGVHKITVPVSASNTHSLRNVRKTSDEQVAEVGRIADLLAAAKASKPVRLEASISTAFGCSYEGRVDLAVVERLAEKLCLAGCHEVSLADTAGTANPRQVKLWIQRVRGITGASHFGGLHFHNTLGMGLANVMAGLEVGVSTFDSSLGGLGGCPFMRGASGNVVTEDLVVMLHSLGVNTGIDLDALMAVRLQLEQWLPTEHFGGFASSSWDSVAFAAKPSVARGK